MGFNSDWSDYIDAALAKKAAANTAANTSAATTNGHHPEPDHPLVKKALDLRLADLSATPSGQRNDALNIAAGYLGRFPVPRDQLFDMLIEACRTNGLLDDDGYSKCAATIASGFKKADLDGPRVIEDYPRNKYGPVTTTEVVGETDDVVDPHQRAVERKAYEMRVTDEARALWGLQRAAALGQEAPRMTSMPEFLAIPDEPVLYRVDGLFPVGSRVLLSAQYKAGKTSLIANLLRSLVDGDLFLGNHDVTPIGRILLIDTELDERMLRRWLRDQGIRNQDAINIVCLRGRLSTFGITDDRTRAEWATIIDGAELIILDCLRPCLDALGLSEDKEAGMFLTAFDALCKECGAGEAVVVHHMGHTQERSRGDSRLQDWPDVLWKIVRDTDEDGDNIESGDRFFSAVGRDVNIPESQLDWQPETRALTICGTNRMVKKARGIVDDIIEIMRSPENSDGLSRNQLVAKLTQQANGGHGRNLSRTAVATAVNDGVLVITIGSRNGPRGANIHILNPSHR